MIFLCLFFCTYYFSHLHQFIPVLLSIFSLFCAIPFLFFLYSLIRGSRAFPAPLQSSWGLINRNSSHVLLFMINLASDLSLQASSLEMGPEPLRLILPVMGQKAKRTIRIRWEPGPSALISHQLILTLLDLGLLLIDWTYKCVVLLMCLDIRRLWSHKYKHPDIFFITGCVCEHRQKSAYTDKCSIIQTGVPYMSARMSSMMYFMLSVSFCSAGGILLPSHSLSHILQVPVGDIMTGSHWLTKLHLSPTSSTSSFRLSLPSLWVLTLHIL